MVKKQLHEVDYAKPAIVEILVQVEEGFTLSDQFENVGESDPDSEF